MDRWCELWRLARGAIVPVEQCWRLARRWYQGRLDPHWARPPVARAEETFRDVGLTGPFWRLR